MASRTHSNRCRVRIAARTCVESVRCVPRALSQPRALQAARKVSRNRWPASWVSKRPRKSCNSVKSKPGSDKSRLRAYFQSMQRRTASAAWRSVSPSMYCITITNAKRQGATSTGRPRGRIQIGEELIVIEGAELGTELHIEVALWGTRPVRRPPSPREPVVGLVGARSWLTSSHGNDISFSQTDSA